jgi:hypothetical protein
LVAEPQAAASPRMKRVSALSSMSEYGLFSITIQTTWS